MASVMRAGEGGGEGGGGGREVSARTHTRIRRGRLTGDLAPAAVARARPRDASGAALRRRAFSGRTDPPPHGARQHPRAPSSPRAPLTEGVHHHAVGPLEQHNTSERAYEPEQVARLGARQDLVNERHLGVGSCPGVLGRTLVQRTPSAPRAAPGHYRTIRGRESIQKRTGAGRGEGRGGGGGRAAAATTKKFWEGAGVGPQVFSLCLSQPLCPERQRSDRAHTPHASGLPTDREGPTKSAPSFSLPPSLIPTHKDRRPRFWASAASTCRQSQGRRPRRRSLGALSRCAPAAGRGGSWP
jgi:hypothetical protein